MKRENQIEERFIEKLQNDLKYTYRPDIRDRYSLENNFREKFEALNRVRLTDSEFERLLESIISPDVYASSKMLREVNYFEREDGTPLNYTYGACGKRTENACYATLPNLCSEGNSGLYPSKQG